MTDFIFLIVGVVLGAVGWWFYTTLFNKYRELKTEVWLKKKELESLNERISKKMRELDDVREFWDWKLGIKR